VTDGSWMSSVERSVCLVGRSLELGALIQIDSGFDSEEVLFGKAHRYHKDHKQMVSFPLHPLAD
jgi:hypothetical protein